MRIPQIPARRRPRIEIIPLIDIMFFLLATFVMVSLSMMKNHGILVRLPAAASATPQERATFAAVTVTEAGALYLNREPMDLATLSTRLEQMKQADPKLRVFLQADQRTAFGEAIRVLDAVRLRGITNVAIQTSSVSSVK